MTEPPTEQQTLERAAHAKQLLDDELFKEALLTVEKNLIDQWRGTEIGPNGASEREAIHYRLTALKSVAFEIRQVMDDGDFLKAALKKKEREEQ